MENVQIFKIKKLCTVHHNIIIIQVLGIVYNVTFPVSDLYAPRLRVLGIYINPKPGMCHYIYSVCHLDKCTMCALFQNIKFICMNFRNGQKSEPLPSFFYPVSQREQINCIFNDNVRILCLFCNTKKTTQMPNCLKMAETSVVLIVLNGAYTVAVSFCRST